MNLFDRLKLFLSTQSKTKIFAIGALLIVLIAVPLTIFLSNQNQDIRQRAAATPSLPAINPITITMFGQKSITEAAQNAVTGKGLEHASGVLVDTNSSPNKVYVVDTGNNRILGYNGAGTCSQNQSLSCTVGADCGSGNTCVVNGSKDPDIVFGQPDLFSGACNRDNNRGYTKSPTAATLCLIGFPSVTNITEYWMFTNIDVDHQGNLYVPDVYNNRILKYNQPFSTDKSNGKGDNSADFVIGQPDMQKNGVNGGTYTEPYSSPNNQVLWTTGASPKGLVMSYGVSVDSQANVWVADPYNSRVLRFPPNSNQANLVLGQLNFTTSQKKRCDYNFLLDTFCYPSLAKVDPQTGKLYVLDNTDGFETKLLVFNPPFTNGMSAAKVITPNQDGPIYNGVNNSGVPEIWPDWQMNGHYAFRATGLVFNPYKQGEYADGVMWVTEHGANRILLLDENGTILKVINAKDKYQKGGDQPYRDCPYNVYSGFNLFWPGGSIGIDSANNMYLADETFHRIARYALPYNPVTISGTVCLPQANGGLFKQPEDYIHPNVIADFAFNSGGGIVTFGNQLIAQTSRLIKVWNNYTTKPTGAAPDFILSQGLPNHVLINEAVDDKNRLWTFNDSGKIRIYQLPITQNNQTPIADNVSLYWTDDQNEVQDVSNLPSPSSSTGNGPVRFDHTGITFDKTNKAIYIADRFNNRVLRITNYNNFSQKLLVDMVLGQPDKVHGKCNHDKNPKQLPARADGFCQPVEINFDKLGNLYVVENTYECRDGNDRITVFLANDLKTATGLFPNLSAKKVFITPDFTSIGPCGDTVGFPGSPVTLAFNSRNQMVVGNDGYYGDAELRATHQLWLYNDPITKQTPDASINLPLGAPGEITFDANDNLIVQDGTWNRVWVLANLSLPNSPLGISPVISAQPINTPVPTSTAIPTVTLAPTATPTPRPTNTPTPTITPFPTNTPIPPTVTLNPTATPPLPPTATLTPVPACTPTKGGYTTICQYSAANNSDYTLWKISVGRTYNSNADFNGDNTVNIIDLNLWRNRKFGL